MKLSIREDQYKVIQSYTTYQQILDEAVFKLSILTEDEEREPDMEWDFTPVNDQLKQASSWVKTKEDAIEFVKKVRDKVIALSDDIKRKVFQYTMYIVLGLITTKQFYKLLNHQYKPAHRI